MCEHYVAHGLCADYPDWTIAAPGTESLVKIGYDYGRSVTGEKLEADLDSYEEEGQTIPNPSDEGTSMVALSTEVCAA